MLYLTPDVRYNPALKSDRLLALLLALQSDGKCSAPQLAQRLEVSTRTIYRDVDALAAAGVPVHAERGPRGGVVLADAYRDALARFNEGELHALFVSTDDVLGDVGLVGRRGSALAKIAAVLPRNARGAIERNRGRVHVDQRRWYGKQRAPEPLAALRDAVWGDRRVTLGYRDRNGAISRRTLDPLGLVAKAGVWYLVARDDEAIKSFRIERVSDVTPHDERFKRPPGFDVGAYWKETSEAFLRGAAQGVEVTLRATEDAMRGATSYLDVVSCELVDANDERPWRVCVRFASIDYAEREAFGYGESAIVIEPAELRERLLQRARAVLTRYTEGA